MADTSHCRIAVVGTGPSGLITALALAAKGHDVTLVGPSVNRDDPRTTAIMGPGLRILSAIGLPGRVEDAGAPLKVMRIIDGTSRLVRAPTVAFHASDIGERAFGYNIPNRLLNRMLDEVAGEQPSIERCEARVERYSVADPSVRMRLSDGRTLVCQLVVGADGRNSAARGAAGIRPSADRLPQTALVTAFRHAVPHGWISNEIHTENGPFTQVPLPGGDRSSLVWVMAPHEARRVAALDDGALAAAVERRMQSMLGVVTIDGPRGQFPLSTALPPRFADRRVALVGEAAHVFPPIGAQGLNLAIRDAADLARAVPANGDAGAAAVTAAYDRARRTDILARSVAVRSLNRSLLTDMLPAQLLRTVGLDTLRRNGMLRELTMREGMAPGSGFSALAGHMRDALREQVDRYRPRPHEPEDGRHRHH